MPPKRFHEEKIFHSKITYCTNTVKMPLPKISVPKNKLPVEVVVLWVLHIENFIASDTNLDLTCFVSPPIHIYTLLNSRDLLVRL